MQDPRRSQLAMIGVSAASSSSSAPVSTSPCARDLEGLERARPDMLEPIEITPSGLGLHFPKLDADLYLPTLLEGVFGTRRFRRTETAGAP
jgi:hypothetical protein